MIPKTIHYCWFGQKEKPDSVKKMIGTWKTVLKDYEIKEWNEHNFDVGMCAFTREAYAMGDYAFVSDVCRLKVLYDHGGIYLDTDVEVLRTFDEYLSDRSFCGYEARQYIGTGVIGAEAGSRWIGKFLDFYTKRHFINISGHPVRTPNTKLLTMRIMPRICPEIRPKIYPIDRFSAKNWETGETVTTPYTVCIHHYARSWTCKKKTVAMRAGVILKGLRTRYFSSFVTSCKSR